jgi:prevent-host-death family protein
MSEFRTGIASFLKQVHDTKRPLIITQHGKGVAVLLDVGEYELMQEKIELLKDIHARLGSSLEKSFSIQTRIYKLFRRIENIPSLAQELSDGFKIV